MIITKPVDARFFWKDRRDALPSLNHLQSIAVRVVWEMVRAMVATGVYVGNDPSALAAYATWVGKTPNNVLNSLNQTSWSAFDSSISYEVNLWKNTSVSNIWSVPLTVNGTSLEQVATGAYNSHFLQAAQSLAQTKPSADGNLYIRVGWEFNIDGGMPWAASGHEGSFIKAFQELVTTFRSVSDKFKFVWDVNEGGTVDPAKAYPGDKFVDVVGMDVYYKTQWDSTDPATAFQAKVSDKYGLQWQQDFAAAHGKATAISEWGIATNNSGPYIQAMTKWMADHNMVYENYWNSNADYSGQLNAGQYPDAGSAYRTGIAGLASNVAPTVTTIVQAPTAAAATATVTPTSSSTSSTDVPALTTHVNVPNTDPSSDVSSLINQSTADLAQLYLSVLKRAPDAAGMQFYQNLASAGTPLHDIAQGFLSSDEYERVSTGFTDKQFVNSMYGSILGRTSDEGGERLWNNYLVQGGGRDELANALINSPEFQSKYAGGTNAAYVEGLYEHVLGRTGDSGGSLAWGELLNTRTMTRASVAQAFTASAEFQAKYVALNDSSFVDSLYVEALGRHVDAGSLQAWTNALAHGSSRADVVVSIVGSTEAHAHLLSVIEGGWHTV